MLGTIRGIVKDANGFPVKDASIVIVIGPDHTDLAALTDNDGKFDFGNLNPGMYVIKAYESSVESEDISVRVFPKKVAFVEIWLEPDSVYEDVDFINEL